MKLDIKERIFLSDILTTYECPFIRIGVVKKLMEMTAFTAEELDSFNLVQLPNGQVRWDIKEGVDPLVDLAFSGKQAEMVKIILMEYPKLSSKHFTLLEKFGVKLPEE